MNQSVEKSAESEINEIIENHENAARLAKNRGRISLNFIDGEAVDHPDYPNSYYTFSAKERLLLIYAENIRREFCATHPNRSSLILAIPNECGIQKCVSTTIRPSVLLFPELIDNWMAMAQFVADFIVYQPFDEPTELPKRLISPERLLKSRHGNSFEMATLLCSLLIGNRYGAMVVSGYASREVGNMNLTRIEYSNIPQRSNEKQNQQQSTLNESLDESKNKYKLPPPIDLRSKFLMDVERRKILKANKLRQREAERQLEEVRQLEKLLDDELSGKRRHAWVVILSNVPWAAKKGANGKHELPAAANQIRPFFIEPTTGVHFEMNDSNYHDIDSVWHEGNYFINLQDVSIEDMEWNFDDHRHWQILLTDESIVDFVNRSETPDQLSSANINLCARYLDMPISWVDQFTVSNAEYDERYLNGSKKIHYKRAIFEAFSPYLNAYGLVKQLTLYKDLDYTEATIMWQWYRNRDDLLEIIETDYEGRIIYESYNTGRMDSLRRLIVSTTENCEKTFEFYEKSRLDGLIKLEVAFDYIKEHYEYRKDRYLEYREFHTDKQDNKKLLKVNETFRRNEAKAFSDDILMRTYNLTTNEITIQFHYGNDDIRPTIRKYKIPPKPDYGNKITFNEEDNPIDETNAYERGASKLKRYQMLLEQLRDHERCIAAFEGRHFEMKSMLLEHQNNIENPILTHNAFDPLRNTAARSRRLAEHDRVEKQRRFDMASAPDILGPYLVRFNHMPNASESLEIFEQCLDDMKAIYTEQLDNAKVKLDEICREEENLKTFLSIIHDRLNAEEYQHYLDRWHDVEVSKRVLNESIANTEYEYLEKRRDIGNKLKNVTRLTVDEILQKIAIENE